LGKIPEKLGKNSENASKISENLSINGTQYCLT